MNLKLRDLISFLDDYRRTCNKENIPLSKEQVNLFEKELLDLIRNNGDE